MKLGTKIALGFISLVFLAVLLGGMSVWSMKGVEGQSVILANEYVPEVKVANDVERNSLLTMYALRGYGLSEEEQFLTAGREAMANVKKHLDECQTLANESEHLVKLKTATAEAQAKAAEYEQLINDTEAVFEKMTAARKQLDENAATYMKNCADFLASQDEAFKLDLEERLAKVTLVDEIVASGTKARVLNFKSQATNDPALMEKAIETLDGLGTATAQLRKVTRKDVNIKQIDDTEASAAAYSAAMTGYLKTQHGLEDHRQKMNETAATYMSNCQAFLAGQQERMKKELKEEGADLDERLEKITLCSTIIDTGNEVRVLSFKSQAAGEPKYMQEALEKLKGTKKLTAALRGITRDDTDIQRIDATEEAADGYYAAMEGFLKDYLSLGDYRKSMDETAGTYVKNCNDFLASQYAALQGDMLERMKKIHLVSDIVNMGNGVRLGCFKAQALRDPVLFQKVQNDFGAVNEKYEALSAITRNEVNIKQIAATKAAGEAYGKAMTEFLANWNKAQDLNRQRTTVGSEVLALTQETSNAGMTETDKIAQEASASLSVASTTMIVGLAVAVVIGCLLAFFITRGITKPLNRIITGMNEGADQVNDAAGQVSTASQQLAEGASEQASSLEETSSALEQMAAMTRTNAENAKQANNLSGQARNAAQSGDKTMHKLNEAMTGINESSGKISKIIKVIEEIAFQTNLLALNAAVEAARAGEHGKGFAVVADEVRNLAQRAAQAARETTGLIEDSVNKAKEGTEVAGEVGKALGAIVGDVTKVTDLIDGITKASEEQAQGVDQVNTAVGQMDKVTQQNAAGAEESASAAEEMAAQAQAVKGMVDELSAMVGGKSTKRATTPTTSSTYKAKKQHKVQVAHLKKKELHTASVGAPAGGREETSAAAKGGLSDDEFMGPDDKNGLSEF